MKNLSYFLLLLCVLEQSCGISPLYKRAKITRTVSKAITLNFSVNQVGDFKTFQLISSRDIINLFDQETDKNRIFSSTIEKIDVRSVKIGANVLPNNTATQVVLSADVVSGALLETTNPILNETKPIIIPKEESLDFGNALGAALEITDEVTIYNAIKILNAGGTKKLKEILEANLSGINRGGLSIRLNGTVPANQRLVMTLTIQIDASITFSRCEEVEVFKSSEAKNECV